VSPGIQGGSLMHAIAAKAVAFGEALAPSFKTYVRAVVDYAKVLAATLKAGGLSIVSDGTDCHMVLVDLRPKRLTGKIAEASLERAGLTCNKNAIPFDLEKPAVTSGIRLGTPAGTTRGLQRDEWVQVGQMIVDVLDAIALNGTDNNGAVEARVRKRIASLCERFPIYADTNHESTRRTT
jgi:glycine hydroxymethyltransferase